MSKKRTERLVTDTSRISELPILSTIGLTKRFPGVLALDHVNFSVSSGEIVALLGQNGAGKSTLIQIIAGSYPPGSFTGTIVFNGQSFNPSGVSDAEAAGVVLVPQEANILPDLTVAENITLNSEPTHWGLLDVNEQRLRAKLALEAFEIDVHPASLMSSHDLATQQLIVIARALAKNVKLLILDEPTAALTEHETQRLFDHMRTLRSHGVSIIFVSHRLGEVFAIADRLVVMRDGRIQGSHSAADTTRQDIVTKMIGSHSTVAARIGATTFGEVALETQNLCAIDNWGRSRVQDLDLTVHRGEIVGLFGLLGSGCIEAALSIYGAWTGRREGHIFVDGHERVIHGPYEAVKLGMGFMAQDRRDCLIGDQSICDNIAIASLEDLSSQLLIDVAKKRWSATDQLNALAIKANSIDTLVGTLSGGNQQKVQVGRWLAAKARILIMVDPTRGVDVGARLEIKQIWSELSARGHCILLASSDVEELVDICDRVVVMRQGREVGQLARNDLTELNLVRMAADG